jgi:cytochrome c
MYIANPFFPVRCLDWFVNQGQSKSVKTTVAQQLPAVARKETMKSVSVIACVFSLTALTALPAFADTELATKKNCMACHAVDKKQVGPSYKDVAAKYAGQKDAVEKLTQKVMKGGSGVWGAIPMPANPQVSAAEAKQLVEWVISQK